MNFNNCTNFLKKPFTLGCIEEIYYNFTGIYCMKNLKLKYECLGPQIIKIKAKCEVKDFMLLLYLLSGKNEGSFGDDNFKTQINLWVDYKQINIQSLNFSDLVKLVGTYDKNLNVDCVAVQDIIHPDQIGVITSTLLHLKGGEYDLHNEELCRELLVLEGKIEDVAW